MVGISIDYLYSLITDFVWRLKLAAYAFVQAPSLEPVIRLKNGAYIDLSNKKIVLTEDTHIHCNGDLTLSSSKHLMLESGKGAEAREGYVNSIWFNAPTDIYGRPVQMIEVLNPLGERLQIPLKINNGKIVLPVGFKEIS